MQLQLILLILVGSIFTLAEPDHLSRLPFPCDGSTIAPYDVKLAFNLINDSGNELICWYREMLHNGLVQVHLYQTYNGYRIVGSDR